MSVEPRIRRRIASASYAFLQGGPDELSLYSRSFQVSVDTDVITMRCSAGHCSYKRTDRVVYFAGERCLLFEWISCLSFDD